MHFLCEYHQTIKIERDYDHFHSFQFAKNACFISAFTMVFPVRNPNNALSK